MKKIENFMLTAHTNSLYKSEAISSISLTKDIADKINELVDAINQLNDGNMAWKQEQEGKIRKGVIYMKDNLLNTLNDLLRIYDNDVIKNAMMEAYGAELEKLQKLNVFVTPQMFGAEGDGVTNDIAAIEDAIESLKPGGVLYFPKGTYLMQGREVFVNTQHITFAGEGLIMCDYGFRPKASNFRAVGLRMESIGYSTDSRAFMVDNTAAAGNPAQYIENFVFKDCHFTNFFYSVYAAGGSYSHDGTEEAVGYPVRDVVIENCYSETYDNQNAGHFQCIQVENICYINNRTYGGQNASSYNAIKCNGYIRVVGNYDHNNSYASCEIENESGRAVVASNTFNSEIWIDDAFDAVVNGNTTESGIKITVGSNVGDAANIVVSNNICKNIRCEQFGNYLGGLIKNVNIIGNVVNGDNTHGIWIHGNAVTNAKICDNFITGTNTNDIAIQRNDQLVCYVSGNFGNGKLLLIAGTGGIVYAVDCHNMTVSGTRDSLEVSHYERAFSGVKILDADGVAWRINVNTSGEVYATQY